MPGGVGGVAPRGVPLSRSMPPSGHSRQRSPTAGFGGFRRFAFDIPPDSMPETNSTHRSLEKSARESVFSIRRWRSEVGKACRERRGSRLQDYMSIAWRYQRALPRSPRKASPGPISFTVEACALDPTMDVADILPRRAALLNGNARVTILCGSGCAGAHAQLLGLAERLQAPVVHAMRGKEHVEWENPYDVGMTGLIGFSSGYYAMLDTDVLLMLGTDFPYRQFYPQGSAVRIAQVDIRPAQIGKRAAVDLGLVGDVRATIEALLPLLSPKADCSHLAQAHQHYAKAQAPIQSASPMRNRTRSCGQHAVSSTIAAAPTIVPSIRNRPLRNDAPSRG
jgi:hypothetical protein